MVVVEGWEVQGGRAPGLDIRRNSSSSVRQALSHLYF